MGMQSDTIKEDTTCEVMYGADFTSWRLITEATIDFKALAKETCSLLLTAYRGAVPLAAER